MTTTANVSPGSCEGKIPYRSQRIAKRKRRYVERKKGRYGLRVYLCPQCHGWHLGHGVDPLDGRKGKRDEAKADEASV